MSDEQTMLAEMAGNLFASLGPAAQASDWAAVAEVELAGLLVPEAHGGFGGSWDDAVMVLRLAGYHALALPVAEAVIAAYLAARTSGRGTIASGAEGTLADGRFTGTISGICYPEGADYVVAPAPDGGAMVLAVPPAALTLSANVAGEPRGTARLDGAPAEAVAGDVFALGALARTAQIAGALDAALAMSVDYANQRQQFGRALAKFQAVQQSLATFACEAAAANCAAIGVAQAMVRGSAPYEIAAAKLRANRAVGVGAALAHQVHGAIGFTQDYALHPFTRRLWAWRSEFGNDAYWSSVLGPQIITRGADNFWADITALTD
ncbi:MAG: acyl-CoA dehydrogenase family protein [Erythrobacter sp.]